MRRSTLFMLLAIALVALAVPGAAWGSHGGTDETEQTCEWTSSQEVNEDVDPSDGEVVVYADTDGESGSSGEADVAAGVCINKTTEAEGIRFDGGIGEAGAGTNEDGGTPPDNTGAYAVIDGDDDNTDPSGQSDGYGGVSNFETGDHDPNSSTGSPDGCSDQGSGSNSGGCIGVAGQTTAVPPPNGGPADREPGPVPTPICGNTTGNDWDDSTRDGCETP